MKTVIVSFVLAFCVVFPLKAQERKSPLSTAPPERILPSSEYNGLGAHCKTMVVRRHGVVKKIRKCKD